MRARIWTLVFVVSACGGGSSDRDYGDPIAVDSSTKSGLTSAIESAAALAKVETTPSDATALTALGSFSSAFAVLTPACQAHVSKPEVAQKAVQALTRPIDTTCITVTTGKVTYTNCDYGGGSINGSVSYAAGTFNMDLKVTVGIGDGTTTVTEKGSITVTPSSIKGSIDVSAGGSISGTTFKADYGADFDVALTSGCATGGQIEVGISGHASGQGGSASYSFGAKAEFGPACGDVKLYCAK